MRNITILAFAAGVVCVAGAASAAKPIAPGCFGQERAEIIHTIFQADDTAPGASEWGQIAGDRAGTNGDMNRDYKTACGGDPA